MATIKDHTAKVILRKKKNAGVAILSDFNTYYKPTVIKTVWYCHENGHKDHGNSIENPETNPQIYGQMISKECQEHTVGKG